MNGWENGFPDVRELRLSEKKTEAALSVQKKRGRPRTLKPVLPESRIPVGGRPLLDKVTGALKGYMLPDGMCVRLAEVEVR